MSQPRVLTVGQFSDSAVLHAIRHLGLDDRAGLACETTRVPSSPEQFAWLRDGTIDLAITSPDNVLLYATTDQQPLGGRLDIRMIRSIDRGLGLALFSSPEIETIDELRGKDVGVDVVRSGFALLLFRMLAQHGIERSDVSFVELGATPKRLIAVQDGAAAATILNAESRVAAQAAGLKEWASSDDISQHYLGTVLAVRGDFDAELAESFTSMWTAATTWLLNAPTDEVAAVLSAANPVLGTEGYVELLRDPRFGLLEDPAITVADLQELARIRRDAGAYAPDSDAIAALATA
jgi:ABC-type nitrate/sulfonate/bicarbonate transport system substrate-binding protein